MIKKLILILSLIAFLNSQIIDDYIINGKDNIKAAIKIWTESEIISARGYFERGLILEEKQWLIHYYIAYCDDQLVHYYIMQSDEANALKFLNDGIDHLNIAIKLNSNFADGYGLLSAMYGEKIGIQPWTGIKYGSMCNMLIRKAKELEPNNPRLYMIEGTSSMYTPEQWGGSKEIARELFIKSSELFKNEKSLSTMPDWGGSEIYAWLGQIEIEMHNIEKAIYYYEQGLEIDTSNHWIKKILMPRALIKK